MATSIPTTMKGILIEKTGGTEVLEYKTDLPVPTLKEGEILVKNEYVGINFIDTYFRTGLYPSPKPEILGREAEGHIVSVASSGKLYNLKAGERVLWMHTGAYAEYTAVPASKAHVLPPELKPGIAAASATQGLTAITMIKESYEVKKGDWVLVHAAAGGVGLWLCQLLKLVGAKTIGTASTSDKLALAKANGAEYLVNYNEEKDFVAKIMEITNGVGVNVVYDGTGKGQFENDLQVTARKGTIVSYGNAAGAVPPFAITKLMAKNLKIVRPMVFNYIATREEFEYYTAQLFDHIIKDKLNVNIHHTYPLADVAQAHIELEGRKTTGKLLLKI